MTTLATSFRPSDAHWTVKPVGLFRERITRKQLQSLLLNSADPIIDGHMRRWVSKSIGVGIYELWAEDRSAP